jgi:hypothetical protein
VFHRRHFNRTAIEPQMFWHLCWCQLAHFNVYPDRTLNRSRHTLPDNQCDIAKLMLVCNQLTWIACFNIGLRWWMIEYPRLREW